MSDLLDRVLAGVKTAKQRESAFLMLSALEGGQYRSNELQMSDFLAQFDVDVESCAAFFEKEGLENGVELFKKRLNEMREVFIRVAIEPTEALAINIYNWLGLSNGYVTLMSDQRMLGGVVVEVDGKHVDKSLRRFLNSD